MEVVLNNVQRLVKKRGVSVRMVWDLTHHKYRDASGVRYIPYNRGNNEAKILRRINNDNAKHHVLYARKYN